MEKKISAQPGLNRSEGLERHPKFRARGPVSSGVEVPTIKSGSTVAAVELKMGWNCVSSG